MKKIIYMVLTIVLLFTIVACGNDDSSKCSSCGNVIHEGDKFCNDCGAVVGNNTTIATSTSPVINCAEVGCNDVIEDDIYCEDHLAVYKFERELYPIIREVISTLDNNYKYSVSDRYELKEVIVEYDKFTKEAQAEIKGLSEYVLEIYVYCKINGKDTFLEYKEWYKLLGYAPKIETFSEELYNSKRKAAMGGATKGAYCIKKRDNHYSGAEDETHEFQDIFIVNFEDYNNYYPSTN